MAPSCPPSRSCPDFERTPSQLQFSNVSSADSENNDDDKISSGVVDKDDVFCWGFVAGDAILLLKGAILAIIAH